jgi:hypothetical protein
VLAIRKRKFSISSLAQELGPNRGSVTRDLNKLRRFGLLRLREQANPGRGIIQMLSRSLRKLRCESPSESPMRGNGILPTAAGEESGRPPVPLSWIAGLRPCLSLRSETGLEASWNPIFEELATAPDQQMSGKSAIRTCARSALTPISRETDSRLRLLRRLKAGASYRNETLQARQSGSTSDHRHSRGQWADGRVPLSVSTAVFASGAK